jgi:hypothetical protein
VFDEPLLLILKFRVPHGSAALPSASLGTGTTSPSRRGGTRSLRFPRRRSGQAPQAGGKHLRLPFHQIPVTETASVRLYAKTGLTASRIFPRSVPCYEWRIFTWPPATNKRAALMEGRGFIPAKNRRGHAFLPLALVLLRNPRLVGLPPGPSVGGHGSRITTHESRVTNHSISNRNKV